MTMAENKKILITGSSGFVGSQIAELLVSNNYEVYALKHENKSKHHIDSANYSPVSGDLSSSFDIAKLPKKLDAIVHCAAILPSGNTPSSRRSEIFALNEIMALNVCRIAKAYEVKLVVYSSTANIYKHTLGVAFENSEIDLITEKEYFQSKLNAERLMQEVLLDSGTSLCIFRISTPFGPGENSLKVIPTFLLNAYHGGKLTLFGDLDSTQNYCYVLDIAWAFKRCIELNLKGTYNIGSKSSTTLIQLAQEILSIFPKNNSKIEIIVNEGLPVRSFMPIDISRSRDDMGFNPRELRLGLLKYANILGLLIK